MKINQIKVLLILVISVPFFVIMVLSSSGIRSVSITKRDVAATYKTQCAACHTPKAEKFYDPTKAEDVLVEIILKGKKGEKPPFMPGFQAKAMTAEQAKELVVYMKQLRLPNSTNTQNANSNTTVNTNSEVNTNTNANVNICTCNCVCANANANVSNNSNPNINANLNASSNVTNTPDVKAIEEATATYKAKCMACHTAKADKFFDVAKTDDQLVEAILKGRKGAKPPFMPGYEANGMKHEQAKALVFYMRQLKTSGK